MSSQHQWPSYRSAQEVAVLPTILAVFAFCFVLERRAPGWPLRVILMIVNSIIGTAACRLPTELSARDNDSDKPAHSRAC
jgi:ABC-type microcin C transport system permease subunit YejB